MNSLPINFIFQSFALALSIVLLLFFSVKRQWETASAVFVIFCFVLIGFSTFFMPDVTVNSVGIP